MAIEKRGVSNKIIKTAKSLAELKKQSKGLEPKKKSKESKEKEEEEK